MSTKITKKFIRTLLVASLALNATAGLSFAGEGGDGLAWEERAQEREQRRKIGIRKTTKIGKVKINYPTPKIGRCKQAQKWAALARQAEANGDKWSAKRRRRKAKQASKDCANW